MCDGYNTLDRTFRSLMASTPPGDRSWEIVGAIRLETCGLTPDVLVDILDVG